MSRDSRPNKPQFSERINAKQQAEILNLTHDAIIIHDLSGHILYWNHGALETYGFSAEEALGKDIQVLLKTEFPKPLTEIEQDMAETLRWEGQLIQFARNKRRLLIGSRWVLKVANEDGPSSILVTNTEISAETQADVLIIAAEKQADALLLSAELQAESLLLTAKQQAQLVLTSARQSRHDKRPSEDANEIARLLEQKEQADIVDLTHEAIVVRNLKGMIVSWNRGARQMYGFSKEEAIGRNSQRLLQTEFPKSLIEIEKDLMESNRWEGELIQVTSDGRKIVVASRWVVKIDSHGRPFSILEVNSDISAQKQADVVQGAARQQAEELLSIAQKQAAELLLLGAEQQADVVLLAAQKKAQMVLWSTTQQVLHEQGLLTDSEELKPSKESLMSSDMIIQKHASDVLRTARQQAEEVLSAAQKQAAELLVLGAKQQASLVLLAAREQAQVVLTAAQQTRSKHADVGELERLLAQKEQAEILDLTHDAIVVLDLEGTILYWNRGAHETYGYSSKEALGHISQELLKTEFPISRQEIQEHLIQNSRWDGELIQFTKENDKVVVASRWVLKFDSDGLPFSVLEFNSDITVSKEATDVLRIAKRQAEEVLSAAQKQAQVVLLAAQQSRSDQRLRLVVEAAPNGIVMVDQAGIITLVNSQFEILFGYKRQELLGQSIGLLAPDVMPSESIDSDGSSLNQAGEDLLRAYSIEEVSDVPEGPVSFFVNPKAEKLSKGDFIGQRKDGVLIPVEIGLNPLTIENERFVLASIVDLTERNRYAGLLKEKIGELARSNEELEQFAYVCSHDLQEPLRVISNYTHLLAKRYRGQLDAKADQFIDFTVDASKRMQNLINDLLVFSRLKSNAQIFGKVDCGVSVKLALANLKLAIEECGATVSCDPLPTVDGDNSQLIQLFQNLIGNAIKFRSEASPVISITAKQQNGDWLFMVTDNGIGLDPQFADRIFLIFQRLHVKEKYPGSGIGLAVCKSIVRRHGGRIWVESSLEKGTTFYFTISKNQDG